MQSEIAISALPERIPVFFLSGFLGSGKSTLLNELLADPSFHDTAVIINEFGDIAVDHLLVRQGETAIAQVSTGCLCCAGGTDIRATLFDLHCAASSGLAPSFSRIIVEMSGLGDPAPLINALMPDQHNSGSLRDRTIDDCFYIAGFNTLYDIVTGDISVERYFEALKQVAFADHIILTKTDLAKDPATIADVNALPEQLRSLNASAEILDKRSVDLSEIFAPRAYSALNQGDDVIGWLALESVLAAEAKPHGSADGVVSTASRHGQGIQTFSLVSNEMIAEEQFDQFVALLQESAGPRLLRVKGIVGILEDPAHPRIVHAVQQAISKPMMLDSWPSDDQSTRIVFITDGIDPEPVRKLFDAVANQQGRNAASQIKRLADFAKRSTSNVSASMSNIARKMSRSASR